MAEMWSPPVFGSLDRALHAKVAAIKLLGDIAAASRIFWCPAGPFQAWQGDWLPNERQLYKYKYMCKYKIKHKYKFKYKCQYKYKKKK